MDLGPWGYRTVSRMARYLSNEFVTCEKPKIGIRGAESYGLQMTCDHVTLKLRPKASEAVDSAYERRKTVPNGKGAA